ncbi:MAG TPA: pyridoxal 5'-phosphate synthase glutaminase subunit PdxT [Solirubrobacterales bacterium]|nr:pyridoxal 5'-phosphate synthase glutaminase subunit PdxT [Solirubrobacterales bacterium]
MARRCRGWRSPISPPRTPSCRIAEPELRVGVLAIQGDFEAHARILRQLGAETTEVRTPEDLDGLDGLVIPGGESTTICKGIESAGLESALRAYHETGRPILGTCAGMIVCDASHLGFLDADARRNAFGRQLQSFEADLAIEGIGDEPLRAVFIRAPWIERYGQGVEVLGSYEGHPVAVREGAVLASAFHPELTDDPRFHAIFMAMTTSARERAREETAR